MQAKEVLLDILVLPKIMTIADRTRITLDWIGLDWIRLDWFLKSNLRFNPIKYFFTTFLSVWFLFIYFWIFYFYFLYCIDLWISLIKPWTNVLVGSMTNLDLKTFVSPHITWGWTKVKQSLLIRLIQPNSKRTKLVWASSHINLYC